MNVASPSASVARSDGVPLSRNVTVPVAPLGVTVAVNVPIGQDASGQDVASAVAVLAVVTVWGTPAEVLVLKLGVAT